MRDFWTKIRIKYLEWKMDRLMKKYSSQSSHARCPRCGFPFVHPGGKGQFCWACEYTWRK